MSKKDELVTIQEGIKILDKMFNSKGINELLYYRAIVRYASDYVKFGLNEKAVAVLLKIPGSYFKDHMQQDMESSQEFYDCCAVMLRKLNLAGFGIDLFKTNVPPASA